MPKVTKVVGISAAVQTQLADDRIKGSALYATLPTLKWQEGKTVES